MNFFPVRFANLAVGASLCAISVSASAADDAGDGAATEAPVVVDAESVSAAMFKLAANAEQQPQGSQSGPPAGAPGQPPSQMPKIVFDETWASVGIGAGLVPSYSGSDDYIVFPLPLIVGRVGGVGISPNGPGFVLDVNSPKPSFGSRKSRVSFGPAFRIRNDRVNQIEDEVVEQLEDLDLAVELGGNIGVSFPGVLIKQDTVTLSTQVRWDVAGAHDGMLVEPTVGYRTPLGRATILQMNVGLQFVDDSFAEYYYSVTPAQSAVSGLPIFNADGGLNSIGTTAIVNYDLDGNALNGGFNVYGVVGYTRLIGDGADTPFTDIRGDANQFILGLGIGYTF
ncbi:MAG: MipA/OmpV family protein [Erythrobacter sp.]